MKHLKPKKALGQHFLNDQTIARKIVSALKTENIRHIIEVGPGMGALTPYLLEKNMDTLFIEVDKDAADFLEITFPVIKEKLIRADFLTFPIDQYFTDPVAVIGNFPYNISSQIFFRILEYRSLVQEVVGMLQKEVAERIAARPGSKVYGITSVLLQAFYDIEYLFTVHENVFTPPPKVKSGVVRLIRNNRETLPCDEKLFFRIVKTAFNQRRKMLSNSLKSIFISDRMNYTELSKRPEQLSVDQFIDLTNFIERQKICNR